jgi:RNA polymerase sigma factor (sigma-70 family)
LGPGNKPGRNLDKPDGHRLLFSDRAFSYKRRKEVKKHIVTAFNSFDLPTCTYLTAQYLCAQQWELADPLALAAEIYQALAGQTLAGEAAVEAIHTQIWQRYAERLHHACRQPGPAEYERAWQEMGHFLWQQSPQLACPAGEREDVVQDALAHLQNHLRQNSLKAPRTFFVFALQALRNKAIDQERKRTAVFRGGGQNPLSWEAIKEAAVAERATVTSVTARGFGERRVEKAVSDREVRAKLKAFFQQHLGSEQQLLVAELYFLDGLELKEIAGLMGKRPYEIRLVKARIVQTLRSLTAEEQQMLLELLGEDEIGNR